MKNTKLEPSKNGPLKQLAVMEEWAIFLHYRQNITHLTLSHHQNLKDADHLEQ